MLFPGPQNVADSKGEDRSVNGGQLNYRPKFFRIRIQHSRDVSADIVLSSVFECFKNMGLTVLEERKDDLQEMKEKLEKELNELRRQKEDVMIQLNADDEPELWTKQKRMKLEKLKNLEELMLAELLELEAKMERLERQERLEELMEREEGLEGRGDGNMNRTILECKRGKPEEQSWVGLSILEKEGLKEPTLKELVGQKRQHNSEEIIFADIEVDQSRQSNNDEPFDPDTTVEAPKEFNQASDPRPERPEPIDDDDLRPKPPAIVTPTEAPEMLFGDYRPDPVPATKSLLDYTLMWLYIYMWSYISIWLDTSMWSGTSMQPDTASTINSLSRTRASEDQGTGIARDQLESFGLGLNFAPVLPGDREPSEDKGDLLPDTNVEAPTEFNQASDPQPDPIDDDLRPAPPVDVTKWEPAQTLLGGYRPDPVSASNLPLDDAPMLPETAKMIVDPSRTDASEDQDAELARVQLKGPVIHQDVASTTSEMYKSVDSEYFEDKGELSPDDTNVAAPTEFN
ncbi:hypothetical protein BGX34_000208 [Mortierella sp. NVP85]|nr:hypothetical protein BGX34_000208 [Mortierella sp. NVP85]